MRNHQSLQVKTQTTKKGISLKINSDSFGVGYPPEIWRAYPHKLQKILAENIAYSATMFLPQMLGKNEIYYETPRPIAETFLFKNGIYDMPCSAIVDQKSSLDYIKKFFNTRYIYKENRISVPENRSLRKKRRPTAIIPFSFGKESMLTVSLCEEIGIKPILVNFIEPSNEHEYSHKKKLIKEFEKTMNLKVYTVNYQPGILRYGKLWNLNTELGWGLQTTEYALMCLPFVEFFNAEYIILGNEQSCNDTFLNKEGILTYKAGYDQHAEWTTQQGLLASLLLGRKVEVISFMEPLYEIAINKILHNRYPLYGKYQMSCMADTDHAKINRWCQNCVKCGYLYALSCAFNLDTEKMGFTENLFEKKHAHIYDHFFNYDAQAPAYGSQEELGLAFYLAYKNNHKGYSMEKFQKTLLKRFEEKHREYAKKYMGMHGMSNIPDKFKKRLAAIYQAELA